MSTTTIQKTVINKQVNSKGAVLLGMDSDGVKYWIPTPSWDCNWYWGFGYIQTRNEHSHISGMFGKQEVYDFEKKGWILSSEYVHNLFDSNKLVAYTFDEKEGWELSELFQSFYKLKEAAELFHTGGAHISNNPCAFLLKNKEYEDNINSVLIPAVTAKIIEILSPSK